MQPAILGPLLLLPGLLLAGCGGSSGGEDNNGSGPMPPTPVTATFGIDQRPVLAPIDLPIDSSQPGALILENGFPNLSFTAPLFLTAVPGEARLVVVEQGGRIEALENDTASSSSRTVLDLSSAVLFAGEQGLLGLAFDPNFTQNRFLYVHYSRDNPRRSVISRFSWLVGNDLVDPASEKVLLEIPQPFSNHNGGMLAFGPDGFLYIAMGDGGSGGDPQNNAQDMSTLLGKMLRIDVSPENPSDPYDVPASNPFLGQSGIAPEIWASGLRNPFRFSFDRQTGALWLADVGQNAIEEINLIQAGNNYGWRVLEGTQPFDGSANNLPISAFTPPVFEYDHSQGVAVIGGYVYRGSLLPTLVGVYLYSDFGSGNVWGLDYDGSAAVSNTLLGTAGSPTSFGEDSNGELYLVTRGGDILSFRESNPGMGGTIPVNLSDTGLFKNLSDLTPASGLIEYDINIPFWSDTTIKRRWVAIPDGQKIGFSAAGNWTFPEGSLVVKHFEIDTIEGDPASRRRLETRVLVNRSSGWEGYTWRWNTAGTDAVLLAGRESESITITTAAGGSRTQQYDYPSRTDCLQCHAATEGFVLGLHTRQMNRDFDYAPRVDNQLRSLNHIGYFDSDIGVASQYEAYPDIEDAAIDLTQRAKAYLAVNCAQCHQPGGSAPVDMDLRFDVELSQMGVVDVLPQAGNLGLVEARILSPGIKENSVLWERMGLLDENRMPPLASHVVDSQGLSLIGQWIDSL